MLSLTDLLQQDVFLVVFCYLSVGLIFILLFLYTERKWETDLQRYQRQSIAPYLHEKRNSELSSCANKAEKKSSSAGETPVISNHDSTSNSHADDIK